MVARTKAVKTADSLWHALMCRREGGTKGRTAKEEEEQSMMGSSTQERDGKGG